MGFLQYINMSNYVRGLKRQQIIERWIHGHDDPDYEVFPTKKEGRYVVKKRVEPLEQKEEAYGRGSKSLEEVKPYGRGECLEEHEEEPKSKPKLPLKRTVKSKQITTPKPKTSTSPDMTVGIEILEQLKLLGEEMKHQRKKKEQKEVIKQVVQKQLTKNPRKRKVIKEEYEEDDDEDYVRGSKSLETPTPQPEHKEPEPEPVELPVSAPVFRSRIRNRF